MNKNNKDNSKDEYKDTTVFGDTKGANMTMYVFDENKKKESLGYNSSLSVVLPDGLNLTMDPTYDKKVKFSNDDTMLNKKTSQELFILGEVNRDYKVSTPDEKQQATELTEKLYRRAMESLVTEPVKKKNKRVKRPAKIFGKNKGARK